MCQFDMNRFHKNRFMDNFEFHDQQPRLRDFVIEAMIG